MLTHIHNKLGNSFFEVHTDRVDVYSFAKMKVISEMYNRYRYIISEKNYFENKSLKYNLLHSQNNNDQQESDLLSYCIYLFN